MVINKAIWCLGVCFGSENLVNACLHTWVNNANVFCLSHNCSTDRLSAEIWTFFLQLEMEDEDTIDVFQQQTGGSSL